jgi:spore germination cell wall hydrolase CwlJ-like protein
MSITYTPEDADIMARTVYGEARGEQRAGQIAVAWVIRNRAARPGWWGRDIKGVCLKKYQFSCWNRNDANFKQVHSVTLAIAAFRQCMEVVDQVLRDKAPDPTKGATHYHVHNILPVWAKGLKPCVRIGAHVFYNNVK